MGKKRKGNRFAFKMKFKACGKEEEEEKEKEKKNTWEVKKKKKRTSEGSCDDEWDGIKPFSRAANRGSFWCPGSLDPTARHGWGSEGECQRPWGETTKGEGDWEPWCLNPVLSTHWKTTHEMLGEFPKWQHGHGRWFYTVLINTVHRMDSHVFYLGRF